MGSWASALSVTCTASDNSDGAGVTGVFDEGTEKRVSEDKTELDVIEG